MFSAIKFRSSPPKLTKGDHKDAYIIREAYDLLAVMSAYKSLLSLKTNVSLLGESAGVATREELSINCCEFGLFKIIFAYSNNIQIKL